MDSDTPRPQRTPKHTSVSPKEKTQDIVCMCVIMLNVNVCDGVNTIRVCGCDRVKECVCVIVPTH